MQFNTKFYKKKIFIFFLALCFFGYLILTFYQHSMLTSKSKVSDNNNVNNNQEKSSTTELSEANNQNVVVTEKKEPLKVIFTQTSLQNNPSYHPNVHIFYYAWYRNKEEGYEHWNHQVLSHWTKETNDRLQQYIGKNHNPEKNELATNFYPMRKAYSSIDKTIIIEHFKELKEKSNIHVIVLSWWGINNKDENSKSKTEEYTPMFFEIAEELGLKIVLHLEPYQGRSANSFHTDIKYLVDTYGKYSSFYKLNINGKEKPLFYVYDSYLISSNEWQQVLTEKGSNSIRGKYYDSIFIGLYLNRMTRNEIKHSGFDGFYTYFAATRFTEGSTLENWKEMNDWANQNQLLFIPSLAPGYIDEKVRPWNKQNTRDRENGKYYERMFETLFNLNPIPPVISITSYNEWHEGTQIEPAIPVEKSQDNDNNEFHTFASSYIDYKPNDPYFYINLTKKLVDQFLTKIKP